MMLGIGDTSPLLCVPLLPQQVTYTKVGEFIHYPGRRVRRSDTSTPIPDVFGSSCLPDRQECMPALARQAGIDNSARLAPSNIRVKKSNDAAAAVSLVFEEQSCGCDTALAGAVQHKHLGNSMRVQPCGACCEAPWGCTHEAELIVVATPGSALGKYIVLSSRPRRHCLACW